MPIQKPVEATFGKDQDVVLDKYVHNMLQGHIDGLKDLHENKMKMWDNLIRGIPKEEQKSTPWKNASNLVIQLVGSHVDSLRARVLGNIFNVMPLYLLQLVGSWQKEELADEQREVLEELMNFVGMEPTELDLYRVLSTGIGDAISYGVGFWKSPWETLTEKLVIGDINSAKDFVRYDGPRPEKVPFDRIYATVSAPTIEKAEFVAHRITLRKHNLLERVARGIYSKDAVDKILKDPDRQGPVVKDGNKVMAGAQEVPVGDTRFEWDIYECHFPYFVNNGVYRLIYTYHYKTKTKLKSIFNFYPKNEGIFTSARLGYDGQEGLYGFGFAEMLRHYQEEVSTTHNQRMDNNTLNNTNVFRVGGASKLDTIFKLYPGAVIPAEKDEFEAIALGRPAPESVQYEQQTLALAKERSGVEPPTSGSGGGVQNPKRGIYSAMGTFSVMQQNNGRVNINTTDMRYAHIKLGRLFLMQYAHFGVGDRIKIFGDKAAVLSRALENYKNGRLMMPIKASSASINRELEKQNDMLLTNVMRQHYMSVAEILKALQTPGLPPMLTEYLTGVVEGSNYLMKHILRNFGHDDTSRLIPEPKVKGAVNGGTGAENSGAGNGGGGGEVGPSSASQFGQAQEYNAGLVQAPGMVAP